MKCNVIVIGAVKKDLEKEIIPCGISYILYPIKSRKILNEYIKNSRKQYFAASRS